MKYIVLVLALFAIAIEAKKKHHLRNKADPWLELAQPPNPSCKYPMNKQCCDQLYTAKVTQQGNLCTHVFGPMQSQCTNPVNQDTYGKFYASVCPQQQNDPATYTCQMFAEDVIFYNGNYFMQGMPLQRQFLATWLLNYPKAYLPIKQKCATI